MQFSQEIWEVEGYSEIERKKILGGLSKKLEGKTPMAVVQICKIGCKNNLSFSFNLDILIS